MPREAAISVTLSVTQYHSACMRAFEMVAFLRSVPSLLRASTALAISAIVCARKLLLQSLDRGRRRLAQNRKDMGADRTGCARRRPVLGEELDALQRSEDIAQSNVLGRPRQFEAASRTEPGADQSSSSSSAKRGGEPRPDWCWRYPPHPPNAGPCLDWRRARSANERQRQIWCSFPSPTLCTTPARIAKPLAVSSQQRPATPRAFRTCHDKPSVASSREPTSLAHLPSRLSAKDRLRSRSRRCSGR